MMISRPSIDNNDEVRQKNKKQSYLPLDFLAREFKGKKEIKIGLVNIGDDQGKEEEWRELGKTSLVNFERVSRDRRWEDYFPEWIDEEKKWRSPSCPEIPMPNYENYDEFDVVVSNVPCGNESEKEGIRDVFRLQVNLVVANLVVRNGRYINGQDRSIYVVFIGSCGPMWEIFRCDDLIRHEGKVWIYKPDLRRLKQKVLMPVGTCQLGLTYKKQGEEKFMFNHSLSKLNKPIEFDHPKEAYVTLLHSSETYVCGAIALAQSIIQTNSTKDLVLLADKKISEKSLRGLRAAGWKIKQIERIRSPLAEKNAYNEWNYSKLRIWQLTQYDKIIFIDSDLVILKNIDEFFEYPQLSAVGNNQVLFNSGLMLIEPSNCVFEMLMKKRYSLISYNGGDQGFLNEAFTWWHRLQTKLNYLKNYENVNDTKHVLPGSVFAIHYLGLKPWMCYRDYDCNWDKLDHRLFASDSAHKKWWRVYDAMPKRLHGFCDLSKSMDLRIKKWRRRAEDAGFPDEHWKIKVKDPRQHH
ncbi:Glycosyl transferase [Macleaya cordata]|uniref:Hexosyltransferase n=1 Tax=Macleaya cordata TaxID=56857 RepID=A0A200QQ16_MACCD|nr:Glycosyl transferase [Macleaya cordata]